MCRDVAQRHNNLCRSEPTGHLYALQTFWHSLSGPCTCTAQLPENHAWSHSWLLADQQPHKHCREGLSASSPLQP